MAITATTNPLYANANNLYTYTTTIQEGNGSPIIVSGNSNNEIVFAPISAPIDFNDIDLMQ